MDDAGWLIRDAAEWERSDDARKMLRTLRKRWPGPEAELDHRLHRYLLACCRRIWRLLPGDPIRMLIEAAERHVDDTASKEKRDALVAMFDLAECEYICIFPDDTDQIHPGRVDHWLGEFARVAPNTLRRLIHLRADEPMPPPVKILYDAACFAFSAANFQSVYVNRIIEDHQRFLSAHILREAFENPFASKSRSGWRATPFTQNEDDGSLGFPIEWRKLLR